ncbi:MAG: S1C family serine protease, partial [Paracoccaceae bacterium]
MISKTMTIRAARKGVTQWMMAALAGLVLAMTLVLALAQSAWADTAALDGAMDAVLTVRTNDAEDRFLGSAFLWGEVAEVAVTNAHVVGDAEEVRLVDRHGNEEVGLVIARDSVRDVAVISLAPRADGSTRRGLVAATDVAGLGLEVFALGAPLGIEFTLTEGL